jgi:hypothetical protein
MKYFLRHEAFWPVIVLLYVAVFALVLGGCQTVTVKRGDETFTATAFLTKLNLNTTCAQYDTEGNLVSQTAQTLNSTGDVDMLHEAGNIFAQGFAAAVKLGGKAATGGVAGVRGVVTLPSGQQAYVACNGEHGVVIPMLESKEP